MKIDKLYQTMPKKVKIGAMRYRIEVLDLIDGDDIESRKVIYGQCEHTASVIRISRLRNTNKGLLFGTLLHEIAHAYCFTFAIGPQSKEEGFVLAIEVLLRDMAIHNPKLMKWLSN